MQKFFPLLLLSFFFLSCDSPEQNSTTGNSADSIDVSGDTRGQKGTGVDNTGGTPGPGTLTDTSKGRIDTLDHTSRKGK